MRLEQTLILKYHIILDKIQLKDILRVWNFQLSVQGSLEKEVLNLSGTSQVK